jgi:outer membrane protein
MGLNLAQPIFRGFRTLSQVRIAEATVRAGRETLRNVEQLVLLLAATAYMDVVRDQAIVRLQENNVNVLTNQLRATRDQFNVGEVTRTDVAQAEARRAASISALEVARSNLKASQAAYERVVGSPPGRLVDGGEPARLMPRSLPEATSIAQRENALIVNALYLEQAARYTVDNIRGELLPTVSLNASYTRTFDPSRSVDQQDNRQVTANMTVPIYTGGEVEARVRAAKHTHVARLQQIEQVRTEQIQLVVSAWARYVAAKAQMVSAAAQVRANQTALTGVREEYRVGQRTLIDVLNAEQELLNAQVTEVTARHDAVVQAYTVLQVIGRLHAQELGLGVEIYDAEVHYLEVRRKWFGLSITHHDGRREVVDDRELDLRARRASR